MAGYHFDLCLLFSFKLLLVVLFVVMRAPGIFITANDHSGWIAECKDEDVSSWHPLWIYEVPEGTKCYIQCTLDCTSILGNYSEVIINCLNGNISVAHVFYPSNVTVLSWAHNHILNISKDSFVGLVDTLETLHLNNNSLQHLQHGIFERFVNLQDLDLRHNMLREIMCGVFEGLESLKGLDLSHNVLQEIQPCIFTGVEGLVWLNLGNNMLKEIQPGVFNALRNLTHLYMHSNMLKAVKPGVSKGLGNLLLLDLSSNMLELVQGGVFSGFTKLKYLYLDSNLLSRLLSPVLGELTRLVILNLSHNQLVHLHPDTFQNFSNLDSLILRNISLTFLPEDIFLPMRLLQFLDLSANKLNELRFHPFKGCTILETLNITQNPLLWISTDSFIGLNVSAQVLVDNPASCCFITNSNCKSRSTKSPFLTCGRMLPYDVLRVGIWVVSIFAIVNNILGILVRCKQRKQANKVQFLLITNLSISDLLMGVYLIILLSVDLYYTDYFPSHSYSWRNSILCRIAGSLSVLSSEASVFFITMISIDRAIAISFPFRAHRLSTKSSCMIISLLWCLAFGISITSFLLSEMDSDVYAVPEICVGLPLSRQHTYNKTEISAQVSRSFDATASVLEYKASGSQAAMYFSIAIFTVLNLFCFFVVAFCYLTIFITATKTARKSGRSISLKEDIQMAKKMFLLVLTDFCCWVPIGVLSILVQAGAVEVNPVAYAWIATFILPINSSINPFLYTLGDVIADKVSCSCIKCKKQGSDENIEMRPISRPK